MPDCPDCGAHNPDGATFCGLCSHSFKDSKADPPSPQTDKWSSVGGLRYASREKKGRGWLWLVSALAVVVVAVLVVVLTLSRIEKAADGQTEFNGKTSGLAFEYPSTWEKKDYDYLRTLSKGEQVDPYLGNEVVLMKRGEAIYKHLLVVSSTASPYGEQSWTEVEKGLRDAVLQSAPANWSGLTFINLGLNEGTGARGLGAMYTVTQPVGPKLFQIEGYILKGNITYSFMLTTPLKGGGADEGEARSVFTELMRSITFK
ncbi:MAG: zinc ribbon domain-containing protein [Candidatus Geothermincolia bacterium]